MPEQTVPEVFDSRFTGGPLGGRMLRLVVQPHDLTVWQHRNGHIIEVARHPGETRQADLWEPHHYAQTDGGDGWSDYGYVGQAHPPASQREGGE